MRKESNLHRRIATLADFVLATLPPGELERTDFFLDEDGPIPTREELQQAAIESGVVYFVSGGTLVKIGVTKDLALRVQSLASSSPVPLTVIGSIQRENIIDARQLEWRLHERFADRRSHGEWFKLTIDEATALIAEYGQ